MAQWGSELSQAEVAAIDVAVRVTGQQTVTDFQQRLTNVQGAINVLKQQLQQNLITQKEFLEQIQQLTAAEDKLEASIKRAQNQLRNFNKEISVSGPGMLQFAYALDDIQYGFSAIVNNIPGIVQAFGGTQGVAGGIGIAVVSMNILNSALKATGVDIGKFAKDAGREFLRARDFISDPVRDAADNLTGLKQVIEALNDKPLKTDEDYRALRKLTLESENATRALREWEMLKHKRSSFQQEAVEQIQKAAVESGGAGNVEDALIEIAKRNGTFAAGSTLHGKIAEQEDILKEAKMDESGARGAIAALLGRGKTAAATAEIARLKDDMEKEGREKIAQMMGLGQGEGSRKTLEGLVEDPRNADVFAKHQIDLLNLQAGVAGAAPDRLFQNEREKHAREANKKAMEKQAAADRQAEIEQEKAEREKNQEAEAQAREGAQDRRLEDQIRAKNAAAANKAANQRLQAEREAPRLQKGRDIRDFGREFTGRANAMGVFPNPGEQEQAGKMIQAKVAKGMNPNAAMQATFNELMKLVTEQQAALEEAANVVGPARMQIQALRDRARTVNHNLRRGANQRPTQAITF